MFKNLFKHLEDISANTRQQQSLLSDSGKWSAKISEQLDILNQALLLQQQRFIRSLRIISFTMAGFGACLIVVLSLYSLDLSQSSRKAADETVGNRRASATAMERYRSLGDQQSRLEEQVSHLDSVVAQQEQMIVELKKLNTTAVRTFVHIRRDLDQRQASEAPLVKQQTEK
jgi:hypothetical protein